MSYGGREFAGEIGVRGDRSTWSSPLQWGVSVRMVRVKAVQDGSIAEELGIVPGTELFP
jgi:hypothetical protein